MRYICNSLVKRARSAHNSHKFVSMLFSSFKALQPFEEREGEDDERGRAAFPLKLDSEIILSVFTWICRKNYKNRRKCLIAQFLQITKYLLHKISCDHQMNNFLLYGVKKQET